MPRDQTALPTSRDFYLAGTSALAHRQYEAAEAALRRAVTLDPRRYWGWFTLGLCHAEQGRFLEAAGDFSVCGALVPNFAWSHLNRGLALARAGHLLDARGAYDRASRPTPDLRKPSPTAASCGSSSAMRRALRSISRRPGRRAKRSFAPGCAGRSQGSPGPP